MGGGAGVRERKKEKKKRLKTLRRLSKMKQAQLSSLGVADTGTRHKVPAVSKVHRLVRREWCGEPGGGG